ncbi:hypothetical protein [Mesorhizobium sp. SP-1A]|uniref:hypothetical protein n=1 Tax=Mesorhizobium sp. SP-1A TaxID=3077840 RepID=UPI003965842F
MTHIGHRESHDIDFFLDAHRGPVGPSRDRSRDHRQRRSPTGDRKLHRATSST